MAEELGDIALNPTERVLWSGRPVHDPLAGRRRRRLITVALLAATFACYFGFELVASPSTPNPTFLLFIAICGWILWSGQRQIRRAAAIRSTPPTQRYLVTDQRVVVIWAPLVDAYTSAFLEQLPAPSVSRARHGIGTVKFGDGPAAAYALVDISEPAAVAQLIAQAQADRRSAAT